MKEKWDSSSYLLEWLKSEKVAKPDANKDVGKQELSFISGGNAKWYSRFGRHLGHFSQS